MANTVIANRIAEKLAQMELDPQSIVVLKGIPLSAADPGAEPVKLADVMANKMLYFMTLFGKRKFLTYEEYLLLYPFLEAQYKEIIILNNNIYMEQYPVEECFSDEVRAGLLAHFTESEDSSNDDLYLGDIGEYIALFNGLKEYNGYLLGAYCTNPNQLSQKVITVNLFDEKQEGLIYAADAPEDFVELIEESDYIDLIKLLFAEPDEIHIRISNYAGDLNRLKDHIATTAFYWKEYTDIYLLQAQELEESWTPRPEYGQILQKHWGYSSFRNLSVYDMGALDQGEKVVKQVSQEQIISNLVEEVEKCGEGKDYRDLFVTAPTGAGKSVMFQVPAIYLAEKYNLLTLVISPLIGLMNDQVKNLELKNYTCAKTINSDISPILKQEIIEKVADGTYHILYLSPETLLSRSDVVELIGNRTIGMIVIDEAHIVTTWGKQFRPDYWYLGDHIRKLRKQQLKNRDHSFVIATFTATAIYRGVEDMYSETINSLHMLNPITYLGYVKRNDITIQIKPTEKPKNERTEYEQDKFEQLIKIIKRAALLNKKTLIYFPTVALIQRCYEYFQNSPQKLPGNVSLKSLVAAYHGQMLKDEKQENYEQFLAGEKLVMLATKAFGMGIDINNIELVVHFAPTGNVCDYVQEIGRGARRADLEGEAIYHYHTRDFSHINRLHGMSMIQKYQLVQVLEKVNELYQQNLKAGSRREMTRRRNAMLLDAENFAYIFDSTYSEEKDNINKVKTALLMIQKNWESLMGFSPITVRPVPMFTMGFFRIEPAVQKKLLRRYKNVLEEIDSVQHICRVQLNDIWNKDYRQHSFPKFKYLLYTKDQDALDFVAKYPMSPALCVSVQFSEDHSSIFRNIWDALKTFINRKAVSGEHVGIPEIIGAISGPGRISKYKAQTVCDVMLASMVTYRKKFSSFTSPIVKEHSSTSGIAKYQFEVAASFYFKWVEEGLRRIEKNTHNGQLYLVDDSGNTTKEFSTLLGILEAMGVLTFNMTGGANSQIYIYINQVQAIRNVINAPLKYKNRLLETVSDRHTISAKMLTYLYENDFTNEERWDLLEDYFLGVIPEKVKHECKKERPDIRIE